MATRRSTLLHQLSTRRWKWRARVAAFGGPARASRPQQPTRGPFRQGCGELRDDPAAPLLKRQPHTRPGRTTILRHGGQPALPFELSGAKRGSARRPSCKTAARSRCRRRRQAEPGCALSRRRQGDRRFDTHPGECESFNSKNATLKILPFWVRYIDLGKA